jgi:hypothetical protein
MLPGRSMRPTYRLLSTLAVSLSVFGCSDESISTGDEQNLTAKLGFYELDNQGEVFRDIAVSSTRAYLAQGPRGVAVVDLASMKIVERWEDDASGAQLWADGVQFESGNVIVWGQRDERDIADFNAEWEQSFVIQALDPKTRKVKWSAALALRDAVVDPDSPFVQLPNIHAFVRKGEIAVSFGHLDNPDRVITFPVPKGNVAFDLLDVPNSSVVLDIENPKGIVSTAEGQYVACGPTGLVAVTGETSEVLSADVGFAVDVRIAGDLALVADHDGAVHAVDLETREIQESIEVPDWVEGIEVRGTRTFVGTRTGILVVKTPK